MPYAVGNLFAVTRRRGSAGRTRTAPRLATARRRRCRLLAHVSASRASERASERARERREERRIGTVRGSWLSSTSLSNSPSILLDDDDDDEEEEEEARSENFGGKGRQGRYPWICD
uniref:Uncharacterized protein n=1 Tax=Oryza brachyantha TaxID=4533 RepID=J3L6Z1_ORYBR